MKQPQIGKKIVLSYLVFLKRNFLGLSMDARFPLLFATVTIQIYLESETTKIADLGIIKA